MSADSRLIALSQLLTPDTPVRAEDLAHRLGVSVRTIYRDIDRLIAAGFPVSGTKGVGYRGTPLSAIAPMAVEEDELQALHLGLAIVSQTPDDRLRHAALSMIRRLEAAQTTTAPPQAPVWQRAPSAFDDVARGFSHLPTLRAAIRARQKLELSCLDDTGAASTHVLRPLKLAAVGAQWVLSAWSESRDHFEDFRVAQIQEARALPELFVDEPGKKLSDRA